MCLYSFYCILFLFYFIYLFIFIAIISMCVQNDNAILSGVCALY